jgi:hypothetical protein
VERLFAPVSGRSLSLWRIVFSLAMLGWLSGKVGTGYVEDRWYSPRVFFPLIDGLQVLPKPWMNVEYWVLAAAFCFLLVGFRTRLAALVALVIECHLVLLERSYYTHDIYLYTLLTGLLAVSSCGTYWSVDAWLRSTPVSPVATWQIWLNRFQLGVVYFYAGAAKLDSDWLCGEPMRKYLTDAQAEWAFGGFLTSDPVVLFFTFGGTLFDLFISPLLCWRPTRWPAIAATIIFHLLNLLILDLHMLAPLMAASLVLFLPADLRLRDGLAARSGREAGAGSNRPDAFSSETPWRRRAVVGLLVIHAIVQICIPAKAFFVDGSQGWSYQQQVGSWRMKLNHKVAYVDFVVIWPDGSRRVVDQSRFLNDRQRGEIWRTPRLLIAFARHLAGEMWRSETRFDGDGDQSSESATQARRQRPVVVCLAMASLNGRPLQWLIDPRTDLSRAALPEYANPGWLIPLDIAATPGQYPATAAEREAAMRRLLGEVRERAQDSK